MDLIALVEEYKQHSAHADAEIRNHKAHIVDLEREILKLRANDGQHFRFVRDLEESIRSLDNQLRQAQLSSNKKDEEIKTLRQRLQMAEHNFNHKVTTESNELHFLREEKKRLLLELSLRDHQLTEFEKQIDYQQTSLVNLKVGDVKLSGKKTRVPPSKPQGPAKVGPVKPSDISLYSIAETSPTNSPKNKSKSVLEEMRKELHSDVEVEDGELLLDPEPSTEPPNSKSPRSGKVEVLTDDSEFGGEFRDTIFSAFSSPGRSAKKAGRKWASPRDEEKAAAEGDGSPVQTKASPMKPPKPSRPPKLFRGGLEASELESSRPKDAQVSASRELGCKETDGGTKELDSGLGLHHMLQRQKVEEKPNLGSMLDNSGMGERDSDRFKSITPDTLSPPSSPEGRGSLHHVEETVPIRRTARAQKPTVEEKEEREEKDGEEVVQPTKGRAGRASDRRLRSRETLASIQAIVNESKSRANRMGEGEAPLPADMAFERAA